MEMITYPLRRIRAAIDVIMFTFGIIYLQAHGYEIEVNPILQGIAAGIRFQHIFYPIKGVEHGK